MQYIRRRILRVSGVTVRDEHLEHRVFAAPSAPAREEWDEFLSRKNEDPLSRRAPMAEWDATRERT